MQYWNPVPIKPSHAAITVGILGLALIGAATVIVTCLGVAFG